MLKAKRNKEIIDFDDVCYTTIYCNKESTDITIITHDENLKIKLSKILNIKYNPGIYRYCVDKSLVNIVIPYSDNMFLDEPDFDKKYIINFNNLFNKYIFILEVNRNYISPKCITVIDDDFDIYSIPKEWLKIIIK